MNPLLSLLKGFTPQPAAQGKPSLLSPFFKNTQSSAGVIPPVSASPVAPLPAQPAPNAAPAIPQASQLASAPVSSTPPQPSLPAPSLAQNQQQGGLQGILSEIEKLSPEQKQVLGIGETAEQKSQREGLTQSLDRLISLQEQLAKAGAPSESIANLDRLIADQEKALKNLTAEKFLNTQPGLKDVGITQGALEREVAKQREPIAGALADLLTSRSIFAQQQQQQQESLRGQIAGVGQQAELRNAIFALTKKTGLPEGITSKVLESALIPKTPEVRTVGDQLVSIDPKTQKPTVIFTGQSGGGVSGLAAAVFANPNLFNTLTPSVQGQLIPTLSAMGFKFPTKLTGEQAKAQTNAESGLLALSNIKNAIITPEGKVNKGALLTAGIPISGSFTQLDFNRREVTDVISRLRTGAALTQQEQDFYTKQLPRYLDKDETIKSKINQIGALLSGFAGTPVSLRAPDGKVFTADNMFDEQQRLGVRKAIEEGYELINF